MTDLPTDITERVNALPVWGSLVQPVPMKGGLSNESYTVEDRGGKFVVRFGMDFPFHHVSRERELMAARAAHEAGFAPEIVYAEPGVVVSRFIDGRTYGPEDVRGDIGRIAETMRRFHLEMPRHVSGPGFIFWVFHVIRDYARILEKGGSRMAMRLGEFVTLAEELESVQDPLPIVFGHGDLLPANFIDDGKRLWLIDFEYAGFSTAMFDLAGVASNAGFSTAQSETLLESYFGGSATPITQAQPCRNAMCFPSARSDVEHGVGTLSEGSRRRLCVLYRKQSRRARRRAG